MPKGAACDGVSCFTGTCWYELTRQLMPVASESKRIGVLATYKELRQDGPGFDSTAGWVKSALHSLSEMPPKRKGTAVEAGRLIAVLQGWGVDDGERRAQIDRAREAGSGGYLMSFARIDQSWKPQLLSLSGGAKSSAP